MTPRQALQAELARLNPAAAEMAERLARQARLQPRAQRVVEDTESGRREEAGPQGGGAAAALLSRTRPSTEPPTQVRARMHAALFFLGVVPLARVLLGGNHILGCWRPQLCA